MDELICEICFEPINNSLDEDKPHVHLLPYVFPICPVCKEEMKETGTVENVSSYQCMNPSCINLSRYNKDGVDLRKVERG